MGLVAGGSCTAESVCVLSLEECIVVVAVVAMVDEARDDRGFLGLLLLLTLLLLLLPSFCWKAATRSATLSLVAVSAVLLVSAGTTVAAAIVVFTLLNAAAVVVAAVFNEERSPCCLTILFLSSWLSKANTASSSSPTLNGVTKSLSSSLPPLAVAVVVASTRAGVRVAAAVVFVCDACATMLLARVIFFVGFTSNGLGLAAPVEVFATPPLLSPPRLLFIGLLSMKV